MRGFVLALLVVLLAQPAPAVPPPSAVEAERLIRQLGANDYHEREAATKALQRMGKSALPALRVACADKDAEVKKRAKRLVDLVAPPQRTYWTESGVIHVHKQGNRVFIADVFFIHVQQEAPVIHLKRPGKP